MKLGQPSAALVPPSDRPRRHVRRRRRAQPGRPPEIIGTSLLHFTGHDQHQEILRHCDCEYYDSVLQSRSPHDSEVLMCKYI